MTTPDIEREQLESVLTRLIKRYAVILHNDDVNSMEHVVASLLRAVPELGEQDAERVMLEAHSEGQAVVTVCPLETAELYRDRLLSFSLTATIEPA